MTQPGGGGNDINLAALWIPVMPETSHMGEGMRQAGRDAKQQFEQGFNSGASPESMGSTFSSRLQQSINKGLTGFELPLGLSNLAEKLSGDIDDKLINKLKGEASQALAQYRQEYEQLTQAQNRAAEAERQIATARENGFNKASIQIPLIREQAAANKELETQTPKTAAAFEDYSTKATKLSDVTKSAAGESATLAGVMGGLMVAAAQQLTGAIDAVAEHMIEGAVEAFKEGVEGAKEFADQMIELGETYEHIGIQIQEFSSASGEQLEEMEAHAQAVFGQLDVAGNNVGQTMAQFASMLDAEPGPALDRLTKHTEELQGRFTDLKSADLASIFVAFKTPVDQADSALASLLQSARNSGQDLGQLTSALSGDAAVTLQQAGMNLQQAGAFMGELLKLGAPGRSVMMGLQSAMKEFGKDGLSFGDGMKAAGERLKALGDTAEGQDLAEKLFGTRRWAVAMQAVQDYVDVVNKGPDAFNKSGDSLDEFIERTRTLQNEWEEVKHKAEEAFLPMGLEAVKLAGSGLDSLVSFVKGHMDAIKRDVMLGGVEIIKFARDVQLFGQGLLEFFAPITDGVTMILYGAIEGMAGFAKIAGEVLSLNPLTHDMGEGLKQAGDAAGHMGDKLMDLKVGDKMRDLAEWSKQHPIDVDKASDSWMHFAEHVSDAMDSASGSVDKSKDWFAGNAGSGVPGVNAPPGFSIGGAPGMPGMPGAPGGFSIGSAGATTSDSQKAIARAIYAAVKGQGYSDDTALAAVADAMHESSLNPANENHEKGLHEGLFQTSGDKRVGKDVGAQIAWFVDQLNKLGGPKVVDADPTNVIADQVEKGGYSGGVYDIAGARKILGMQTGGAPGRFVTQGSGNGDDVAALLGRGEYVWDTEAVDKYGWLIKAMHQGAFKFDSGGSPSGSSDYVASGGKDDLQGVDAQISFVDQIARGFGLTLTAGKSGHGTHEIDGGYHDSGEAGDFSNGMQTDAELAFAMYMIEHYGSQLAELIHDDPRLPKNVKDGKLVDPMFYGATTLAGHRDHVHIAVKATQAMSDLSPGSESLTQGLPPMPGVAAPGTTPGGKTGYAFQGVPGQYGGLGAYGGETADQQFSAQQAVTEAQDHASDLDDQIKQQQKHIDDINRQLAEVGTSKKISPLTGKPYPLSDDEQKAADDKRRQLNDELDNATSQLARTQRERGEQDGKISEAQRKQLESYYKKPGQQAQEYKVPGVSEFSQLGGGLLSGLGQELGFGDLFAKPPWEWGAFKLLAGFANWGMGTANAWADEIGKGHTGMTGFQPLAGFEQQGSAGLSGMLGSLGLNIPLPKPQMVDQFGRPIGNVSSGPNIGGPPPVSSGQGPGPAPGPMIGGDYMPINVQAGVDPKQVMAPVQELQNQQASQANTHTGGFPAS